MLSTLLSCLATAALASEPVPAPPPNIVLILADDLGLCDLGRGGAPEARTPRLDALAGESVRVARFRVTPVCAPTRAALLTGRNHLRCGVWGVHGGQDYIDPGEELMPQALARAGYATGLWGKWHSGHSDGYHAWQRGFSEALQLNLYRHRDPSGVLNGSPVAFPGRWADGVIADHAIAFIERNRDRPFLACVQSMTPHTPLDAPEDVVARFRDAGCSERLAVLRAQVAMLDAEVGRVLDAIDRLGLRERTIVLFLSDNGPACNEGRFSEDDRRQRDPGPLRGWKGDIWENGIRVPLFVRWPGKLAPGERDGDAIVEDLLPTLCAWAGAKPAGRPLDGIDLGPWLEGRAQLPTRPAFTWVLPAVPPVPQRSREARTALDEYRPLDPSAMPADAQVAAIVDGRWKLLQRPRVGYGDVATWLVDLAADPGESINLADRDPARLSRMAAVLAGWWQGIRDEPAAFRAPAFAINADGGEVRAAAAVALAGGLRNSGTVIAGWDRRDQEARWRLEIVAGRACSPRLSWRGTPPVGAVLELSCSGAQVRGRIDDAGSAVWNAPLELDPGPASLALHVLVPTAAAELEAIDMATVTHP